MQKYVDQLIKLYNTLLSISTKGEDTVIMGHCLSEMRDTLVEMQQLFNEDTATNNN